MSLRVVLIEPSHPGNIGAVARAIGNMGIGELWLVNPADHLNDEAKVRSASNESILHDAKVCDTLHQAIGDCVFIVGTSARIRTIGWPNLSPKKAMVKMHELHSSGQDVALLFGPERTGLSNLHVEQCDALVRIPVDERAPSINLAGAVLIMLYELRLVHECEHKSKMQEPTVSDPDRATRDQIERLFEHMFQISKEVGFIAHGPREVLKRKMRRIFLNPGLKENEVNILRGFLTAVDKKLNGAKNNSDET